MHTLQFESYWQSKLDARVIDFVKLDVEGHELDVLHGFGDALVMTRLIQFEFGGCNLDSRTFLRDFWGLFIDAGFRLYRITPFGPELLPQYRESDEHFTTTNFLALTTRTLRDRA